MPKLIPSEELDRIAGLVARHPQGVGMEALLRELGEFSRRTLQRRLAQLIREERIYTEGEARALRYRIKPITAVANITLEDATLSATASVYVPTSPEGERVRAHVSQPIQQRRPVGYRIEFLEQYHPNQTHYLPDALRAQLRTMGRSPAAAAPAGTFARDILNRLLIDLSWASSRLEGNTYSILDTERLIEFGQAAEGKDALEAQMILNHKNAIEHLVDAPEHAVVTPETVITLHAFLSDGLLQDPMACGRIREGPVLIEGSVYRPVALPQRLEELFGIVVELAAEIEDPLEQAFFLMVHLPYLQPFDDVNKRVSRVAANIPLIRHNLSPLSFVDVPRRAYIDGTLGIYELNDVALLRDVFVWAYERSCQQYVAVQQQLTPPDTFRLRYRKELAQVLQAIIRGGLAPDAAVVSAVMPVSVAAHDHERFAKLVLDEIATLHEGNVVRFNLRPLELKAWRERQGDRPGASG